MREYVSKNIRRVTKTTARKIYENGGEVLFTPCNMRPENNYFSLGIWQSRDLDGQYDTFDKLVNAYTWYNCTAETGKYIAYYVKNNVA